MMRHCYLSTVELHRLDRACRDLWNAARNNDGGVYLVGSVTKRPDFRDVDVRMILPDAAFDRMFGSEPSLWGLFCYAVSRQLGADTGLPVDFQVQRQTQANEYTGSRNPLGLIAVDGDDLHMGRDFAGGGDATRFTSPPPDPAPAGVSAAPTSRDSHAEDPAGAPIPTTSEPTCDTCHRLLSCVGTCPKGCEQ